MFVKIRSDPNQLFFSAEQYPWNHFWLCCKAEAVCVAVAVYPIHAAVVVLAIIGLVSFGLPNVFPHFVHTQIIIMPVFWLIHSLAINTNSNSQTIILQGQPRNWHHQTQTQINLKSQTGQSWLLLNIYHSNSIPNEWTPEKAENLPFSEDSRNQRGTLSHRIEWKRVSVRRRKDPKKNWNFSEGV